MRFLRWWSLGTPRLGYGMKDWTLPVTRASKRRPPGMAGGIGSAAPIIPRWKPEDVEALLALYEEQLSAIEAQDTVLPMDTVAGSGLRMTRLLAQLLRGTSVAEPARCGRTPLRPHSRLCGSTTEDRGRV